MTARGGPPRITVVGEAVIDLVPGAGTGLYHARPGGSPYNVAIGLARLGRTTTLMARLADTTFGRLLREHAEAEGVDLTSAAIAHEPATLAVVSTDDHGVATYEFYREGTADWGWTQSELDALPADTEVLHFGSIASWTSPGRDAIHAAAARIFATGEVLVSYDPNIRPSLMRGPADSRRLVEQSVSTAHVVKASIEDVDWLYPGRDLADVAGLWLELGAVLVVITEGPKGAHAFTTGIGQMHRPAVPIEVVDTVGAGDAFTAGLLDALIRTGVATPSALGGCETATLTASLDDAILIAAMTCERVGADSPTAAELEVRTSPGRG